VQILQSLLQSDMISFHLFEYARNFINSCERLMNLTLDYSSGGLMSVNFHGRVVGVRVSQIGIDEDFINHIMSSKEYKKWVERFKQEFKVIAEAARKSSVAGAGIGSRSTANFGAMQNRVGQRTERSGEAMSTSQSSNSLYTLESSTIAERYSKPIIICSIDTFSHLSGFVTKLKGFQKFMQTYPSFRNKIVLIQFIPSVYCLSNITPASQSHV
jgi:trehalose-6-phosphate synthase